MEEDLLPKSSQIGGEFLLVTMTILGTFYYMLNLSYSSESSEMSDTRISEEFPSSFKGVGDV